MPNEDFLYQQFVCELSTFIEKEKLKRNASLTFLCIGTTKVIGDSVGPIVGSILKEKIDKESGINVLGDYECNIDYSNIEKQIEGTDTIVVAIDSALSCERNIGKVFVQDCGLKYGESLKRNSRNIGDICIKAVVGRNYNNRIKNFVELNRVSKWSINYLAEIISNGILQVVSEEI